MNQVLKTSATTKIIAAVELLLIYGFVYNPWTSFPYTFVVIILATLAITYLHDDNFLQMGLQGNRSVWSTISTALLLFVVIEPVMDFVVQPLVNKLTGEVADYSAFQSIAYNFPKFSKYWFFILISAGIGEEVLFRGFLFRQLRLILPDFQWKTAVMILLTAILFSLPHLYQGPSGLVLTFIFGLVFATIYVKTNYNLWITIIVHSLVDTLFITLAYLDALDFYNLGNDWIFGY